MNHDLTPVVAGQIYLVRLRMESKTTGERIKHRMLVIGGDRNDVDRRLRWHFDAEEYTSFTIVDVKKVTTSVNVLTTEIRQDVSRADPTIQRADGTVTVGTSHGATIGDNKIYAIGVTTTMLAKNPDHALRLVGHALLARGAKNESGILLSEDSTVMIEELAKPSAFATPRDVSAEINHAHIVRG